MLVPSLSKPGTPLHDGVEVGDADDELDVSDDVDSVLVPLLLLVACSEEVDTEVLLMLVVRPCEDEDWEVVLVDSPEDVDSELVLVRPAELVLVSS